MSAILNRIVDALGNDTVSRLLRSPETVSEAYNRRLQRNIRLLEEFPWLWATRSGWDLAVDQIWVTDCKSYDLSTKVGNGIRDRPVRIESFWMFGMRSLNGRPYTFVEQVWQKDGSSEAIRRVSWEELLNRAAERFHSQIFYAVTVDYAPDAVTIVRPPKPFQTFNEYWQRQAVP